MAIEVTNEIVESFLEGSNPKKYVVAIESSYYETTVDLIINDPETGKRIEKAEYRPFLWFKEEIKDIIYEGKRTKILAASRRLGVDMIRLRTSHDDGFVPKRMENGFKFKATCRHSYSKLIQFFKDGGVDIFKKEYSGLFVKFDPTEQFMIQTGIRLFKGMDDYDDVHRLQYDLETEGLFAYKSGIFQIGIRDNRGFQGLLETKGTTDMDKRRSELDNIENFFKVIDSIRPDIITGYNSENFDWPFLFERAKRLNMNKDITDYAITLNRSTPIKRKPAMVKFGGETEHYQQTNMWGYNILDISHSVRRAMAINSDIKAWGLKYITQISDIAKPNRVYVPGDKINTIWADEVNQYAFNDENGDWYAISDKKPIKDGYQLVKGNYIIQRYLYDDLWETEQIDNLFNQASFLIGKMLPTTFQRSSTMGTAGQWKLIMAAWSFEHDLAIPETQSKRDFTGGLSRLLELGFARNVVKLDFAALYPKTQLTHLIFPDLDITGMMMGALTYIVDTRDKYKFLNGKEKALYNSLSDKLKKENLTEEEIIELKKEIAEHKTLANKYDKKQLPLKILANSWFGSYGAPYIFNWGDTDSAEETTCRGRQYLRLMVRFFTEKYGFKALVLDTDGCNFSYPDDIDKVKYVAKGNHWKTTENAGKELSGLEAVLAEFNETYMTGRMGLDIDDICRSTINFSRKNYANDIKGKVKLVGNSIKSKKMPGYIEDFIGKAIRMLLDGDGEAFIEYYYEYVDKIYNCQIPLVKIASKGKVKLTVDKYKDKMKTVNKAGNPMPRQAHMELAMLNNLDVTLGDVVYYINTGTAKSHGDLKTITNNPMTKKQIAEYTELNGKPPVFTKTVQLNCKLINPDVVDKDLEKIKELEMLKKALAKITEEGTENDGSIETRIEEINKELFSEEYNVARYLDAFNKKVKPLLVCFGMEVREGLLASIVKTKDKTTKQVTEKLKDRTYFATDKCVLVSGIPNKPTDQDSYEELMTMEDKEIKFWDKVNKVPNNMEEEEWVTIRADYFERMRIAKIEGIQHEKELMESYIKALEVEDINVIIERGSLPLKMLILADFSDDDENNLVSRKWGEVLCHLGDVVKYEKEAIEREAYYKLNGIENDEKKYQKYLDYEFDRSILSGNTIEMEFEEIEIKPKDINSVADLVKANLTHIKIEEEVSPIIKKKISEVESEDEESEITIDANGNVIRHAEFIQLDDGIDDTEGMIPDDVIIESDIVLSDEEIFTEEVKVYTKVKTPKVEIKIEVKEEPKIEEVEDEWNF